LCGIDRPAYRNGILVDYVTEIKGCKVKNCGHINGFGTKILINDKEAKVDMSGNYFAGIEGKTKISGNQIYGVGKLDTNLCLLIEEDE